MQAPLPAWDRDPGILTKQDRQYLRGEDEPSTKQARYQRKKGIRKRISNAILDFRDIWDLDEEERRKITGDLYSEAELHKSLVAMMAFLGYCAKDADHDLEWIIRGGIIMAMRHEGSDTIEENGRADTIDVLDDVTVEISPEYKQIPTSESLLERYREGKTLSGEQLGQLIGSGLMTKEDWNQLSKMYGPDK